MIRAVLFDLDDTLFDQRLWLDGAWWAVAEAGAGYGLDRSTFHHALSAVAAEGSDRGRIIDRALARIGAPETPVGPLVDAFLSHRPARLAVPPGVPEALSVLRSRVRVGLVTDGDVGVQGAKLDALGLRDAFDTVVFSDVLGRERRKPHPAPFRLALAGLAVPAHEAVYVGDRPDKDVAGPAAVGMRAVRVRTGEYRMRPDRPPAWALADDVVDALKFLAPYLPREYFCPS